MTTWIPPVWTENFSVGSEELDDQHKQLLDLCQRAVACLNSDAGTNRQIEARSILYELAEYVRQHFRTEEKLMQACEYPDYESHKHEHTLYEVKLDALLAEADNGALDLGEFIHYLTDWWSDHILVMDRAYAPCISELDK